LVNISGGSDLGIMEINEAMSYIYEAVGEDNAPNIIFGTVVNKDFEKKISVTVIATGFASPSGHSRSVQAQETKAPEIIKPVQNKVAPVREPELVYEEETPSINSQEPLYQFEDYSEAAPETPFNMKNLDVRSFVVQEELETETVKRVSEMNEYKQVEKFQLSDIPKQKPVSYSAPFSDMAEEDTDWDTPAFLRNQDH
jgi:hypothetical protein